MIIELNISNVIVSPELNAAQITITPVFSSGQGITPEERAKLAEYPEFPEVPKGYYLADYGTFNPFPDFVTEDEMIEYVDGRASAGGGGLSRYLSTEDSDVLGYKKLNNVPDEALSEVAHPVNVGETLMHKFLYDFPIATTIIDAGPYKLSLIAKLSATAGVSSIIVRFFLRHIDNTETLFLEMSKSISNTTFQQIPIEIQSPAVHCVATDRFGVGIYFSTTLTNKIITTQLGDGASTYITVPIALRHTDLREKNQDAAFQHIDITTTKETLVEGDMVAIKDSATGKMVLTPKSNIDQAFMKLAVRRGATFNSSTGFYELNGLTDITEEQMMDIYNYTSQLINMQYWQEAFWGLPIRTNFKRNTGNGGYGGAIVLSYAFRQSSIEVYSQSISIFHAQAISTFRSCPYLKIVDFINIESITSAANLSSIFQDCTALETCYLRGIKVNISLQWSPLLSLASLQYIIQYRGNGTTPITITVHPTVFAKLTDNVNYPTWYAVAQDALTKFITFATV